MRIAVLDLIFNWPPDGGARVDVKEVWSRIAKIHEVKLFAPRMDDPVLPRGKITLDPGFPVELIPFSRYAFNRWTVVSRFRKAVDRYRPDLVFIADGWYLKPWLASAFRDYPYFLRFYAYETICLRNNGLFMRGDRPCYRSHTGNLLLDYPVCNACAAKLLLRELLQHESFMTLEYLGATTFLPTYPRHVKKMIRNAKRIIVSNPLLKGILSRWSSGIHILPGGFNPELFPIQQPRDKSPVRVAMVGRLTDPNKGYYFLRGAFFELLDRGYDIELWLTGKKDKWFSDIPEVKFNGWYSPETLKDFYREVDICVVPSIWQEPFGIVALEAMSSGKPVIVTGTGGLQDIVEHNRTGLVVPPKSIDHLVESIEFLINNPEERIRLGRAAAQSVQEKYSWDHIIQAHYLPLLESAAHD